MILFNSLPSICIYVTVAMLSGLVSLITITARCIPAGAITMYVFLYARYDLLYKQYIDCTDRPPSISKYINTVLSGSSWPWLNRRVVFHASNLVSSWRRIPRVDLLVTNVLFMLCRFVLTSHNGSLLFFALGRSLTGSASYHC